MINFRDATHADWVKAWLSIWRELQAYIKTHHTTGVSWNKQVGGSESVCFFFHDLFILLFLLDRNFYKFLYKKYS